MTPTYTQRELEHFRILVDGTGSMDQMERISSRLALTQFQKDHGKEKCEAIYEQLKKEFPDEYR
jgi:hypothetical protein